MKTYKTVFFDLDHTIWDFERNSMETLEDVWSHFQLYKLAGIEFDPFARKYLKVNAALWKKYNRQKISKQELRETRFKTVLEFFQADKFLEPFLLEEFYLNRCPYKPHLIDGSIEILDYLKDKGYELHVLSNGFEETTHLKLENSGIKNYFLKTLTSEGLGVTKPQVEFFERSLELTSSEKEDTIMIGDNPHTDIKGAIDAGLDQVFYNPENTHNEHGSTHEIQHLSELKNIL